MYIEGIIYWEKMMHMNYLIIYFWDDFETIFKQQLYSSEKDVGVAITTLLIFFKISSYQNYKKLVAIFCHKYKSKRSIQAGIFTSL